MALAAIPVTLDSLGMGTMRTEAGTELKEGGNVCKIKKYVCSQGNLSSHVEGKQ